MINKMEIVKTELMVKKIGDSYYLHMNKTIRDRLYIKNGAILGVKLFNIQTKKIICPKCNHEFYDYENTDPHDCPECGEEFIDVNAKEDNA